METTQVMAVDGLPSFQDASYVEQVGAEQRKLLHLVLKRSGSRLNN